MAKGIYTNIESDGNKNIKIWQKNLSKIIIHIKTEGMYKNIESDGNKNRRIWQETKGMHKISKMMEIKILRSDVDRERREKMTKQLRSDGNISIKV